MEKFSFFHDGESDFLREDAHFLAQLRVKKKRSMNYPSVYLSINPSINHLVFGLHPSPSPSAQSLLGWFVL